MDLPSKRTMIVWLCAALEEAIVTEPDKPNEIDAWIDEHGATITINGKRVLLKSGKLRMQFVVCPMVK